MSTILILHCSAGAGHRSVARAIDEALTRCCESDEESAPTPPYRENSAVGVLSGETPHHLIADSLCFSGPPFRAMCSKGYEFFARHIRWACGMGYVLLDKPFSRSLLVRAVQKTSNLAVEGLAGFLAENVVEPIMQRPQIIKSAPLMLGYAGVYSSFLLHTYRAAEKFHLNPRDILVELGRRGMVGGQEDMIIDVAHALSLAKTEC